MATRLVSNIKTPASISLFHASSRASEIFENANASLFEQRALNPKGEQASKILLVDFYAEWCRPCKLLSPALKKVASQPDVVGGRQVDLLTLDVDQHNQIASQFKVSAMPTVLAMKEGKVIDGFVGMLPEAKLIEFVKNLA
ncbi:thioredoxin-like protein [Violaceomyces palustris]|uniref:Thioredoxin-like protein n=1 Tax=Violaceomyces palustris TaxID=1673888 RepID=A0ACD0NYW1_9BASI|nr:thioredoxin-like protein [Violaceomyces palustris]